MSVRQIEIMADAAAARREARRRKILENSHNRLDLIAGKKSSEASLQDSSSKYSYSDHIYESPADTSSCNSYTTPVNNGLVSPLPDFYALSEEPHVPIAAVDNEITNDLAGFTPPSEETLKDKSRWENIVTYKYDVVLLALLMQFLYHMFIFETAYFFLPLVIYTVTKLICFPEPCNSSFANVVMLMNGISASKASKIMNVSKWALTISQDVCVYLFITICIQSLINTLTGEIIT